MLGRRPGVVCARPPAAGTARARRSRVLRGALAHLGVFVFGFGMIVPGLGWNHAPSGNDVVGAALAGGSQGELREIQDALPAAEGALTRPEEVAASAEAVRAGAPAPSPLA